MGELAGGVFVSRVDADDWEPDEEVGGWVHMLREDGDVLAGLWKPEPVTAGQPVSVELPAHETIVVLEGVAPGSRSKAVPRCNSFLATWPLFQRGRGRPGLSRRRSRSSGSTADALMGGAAVHPRGRGR